MDFGCIVPIYGTSSPDIDEREPSQAILYYTATLIKAQRKKNQRVHIYLTFLKHVPHTDKHKH